MLAIGKQSGIRKVLLPVLVAFQTFAGYVVAVAQEAQVQVDVNPEPSGGGAWYTTWWFWVLVGIFALIVIVAITSRGKTVVSK